VKKTKGKTKKKLTQKKQKGRPTRDHPEKRRKKKQKKKKKGHHPKKKKRKKKKEKKKKGKTHTPKHKPKSYNLVPPW